MKTTIILLVTATLAAGNWQTFAQQGDSVSPEPQTTEAQAREVQATGTQTAEAQATEVQSAETPVAEAATAQTATATETSSEAPATAATNADGIRMDFRNAPLDTVLTYLSDAAGFIIVMESPVSGKVNIISRQPVSKDEAVGLLNAELGRNGYAAIRDGRRLTIVDRNTARTRSIPVRTGYDPETVPANDEIVTQIIPVRFVEARQLMSDLTDYVSQNARIVANEAGNSIIITDTQANIRHLMEIINAIDNGAEGETVIRRFPLQYANPTDVVTVLGTVFPDSTGSGNNQPQNPFAFFGRGGRGGRGGNRGGNNGGTGQTDRAQKQQKVVAAADLRTSSVVVTASKDLMDQIADIVTELDVKSPRDQDVSTFALQNADPNQVVQVLQNMFQSSSTTRGSSLSSQQQNSALMARQLNNANSGSSTVSAGASSSFGGTTGGTRGGGVGR